MPRLLIVLLFLLLAAPSYTDGPYDFDATFRREFKGIMIHHTGTSKDNVSVKFLSDIQKNTVYKPVFDGSFPGKKMYSNHYFEGKETFFCYHWLVYPDGTKVNVLKDLIKKNGKWYIDYVSWNAGYWDVNGETVSIAISGNYMNREPSEAALKAVASIIASYKKATGLELYVKGHREVKATECPGNRFLGPKGWKKKLLELAASL